MSRRRAFSRGPVIVRDEHPRPGEWSKVHLHLSGRAVSVGVEFIAKRSHRQRFGCVCDDRECYGAFPHQYRKEVSRVWVCHRE